MSGPSVAAGGNGQIKKEVMHKLVFDLTGACFHSFTPSRA